MPNLSRRLAVGLAAFCPLVPLRIAAAQTPAPAGPMTIDGLATMLSNMGYEPVIGDTRKYLTIKSGDYTVQFTIGAPPSDVLIYIYLQKITDEQLNRLNMKQLLLLNDTGPSWFTLEKDGDSWRIYIQRMMPPGGATPATIRASVENLVKMTAVNEDLWNPARWK